MGTTNSKSAKESNPPKTPLGNKAKGSHLGALRQPQFRLYLFGTAVTYVGFWAQVVAQGWLVLRLTESPLMLGIVMSTNTLPFLIFALPGGVIADRFDKRKIILVSLFTTVILTTLLVVLAATNLVQAWHVIVIALLVSSLHAFDIPARQSIIPALVPSDSLVSGLSLANGMFNVGRILGPALAGVTIHGVGEAGAFGLFTIANLTFIVIFSFIHIDQPAKQITKSWAIHKDVLEALIYIRSRKNVFPVVLLAALVYFFVSSPMALLPDFARNILGLTAIGLGNLALSLGIGALASAMIIALTVDIPRKGTYVLLSSFLMGISLLFFSRSTSFALSFMALGTYGFFHASFSTLTMSLLFLLVPSSFHGRVMSLMVFCWGFTAFGNMASGAMAEVFGTPSALAVGGIYIAACALTVTLLNPSFKKI